MPMNKSSKDGWEQLPDACGSWLSSRVEGYRGPGRLYKFGLGQSNPTYRLRAASRDYVLRRKPFGPLLPLENFVRWGLYEQDSPGVAH